MTAAMPDELRPIAPGLASPAAPAPVRRRVSRSWFGLRQDVPQWGYRALSVSSFLLIAAAWWWVSTRELVNPVFLPKPASVCTAAMELLRDQNLWLDVRASLLRVTAGFLLSAAVALPLGIFIGAFRAC